jgi:hypothetical protein
MRPYDSPFFRPIKPLMYFGVGTVRGQVIGHGVDLRAKPRLYVVDLLVDYLDLERVEIDLFFQLIEPLAEFFIQRRVTFQNQIELAVDAFQQNFKMFFLPG